MARDIAFEEVAERPVSASTGAKRTALASAFLKTADGGGSIRVPVSEGHFAANRLGQVAKRAGLRIRQATYQGFVHIWAERKEVA